MTGPPHLEMVQHVHAVLLLEFKLCESVARCDDDGVRVGYVIFEPLLLVERKWNRLTEAGSTDTQSIYEAVGVAEYVTKEMRGFTFDQDQTVLASQFWKN